MTNCYSDDIIGFRVGRALLCRSCFERKGLKNFDSVIREHDPDIFCYDCDYCHIFLFVWRPVQDFIKEQEGWRRIRLREGTAPLSILSSGRVQTAGANEEEVCLREKALTRLVMAAAHKRRIKGKSNPPAVKITVPNYHEEASNKGGG